MSKFYSKVEEGKLLCSVLRRSKISSYRNDICPPEEFLQISGRALNAGTEVPAHKHLPIYRESDITQEAWLIISGTVEAQIFDLDDSFYDSIILEAGDCLVLFRGGHSLKVIDDNTIMYEFKTGPYLGVTADKEAIDA